MDNGNSADGSSSSPLRKYFEQNLRPSMPRTRLQCHVLSDVYQKEDWREEPLGPRRGIFECLQVRHTILVFLPHNTSPSQRKTTENVLVMGMTAWEYVYNDRPNVPSRAYIQYVDTTGLFRPRKFQGSLTRAVVSTYLKYCREVIKVPSVHLFASAKPSLLFNESDKLPRKRVLEGGKLVNWWLALIHSTFVDIDRSPSFVQQSSPRGFVYLPGEENTPIFAQTIRQNLKVLNLSQCVEWVYGVPFRDLDSAAEIPFFEDDPKWRHYEAAIENSEERPAKRQKREQGSMNISEFFQSMSIRAEFRQDPSAFISLQFPENSAGIPFYNAPSRRTEVSTFSCKLLMTLSFSTEIEAIKSSMRIWPWLKLMGSTFIDVTTEEEPDDKDQLFKNVLGQLQIFADVSRGEIPTIAIDVQTLIRRKAPRL